MNGWEQSASGVYVPAPDKNVRRELVVTVRELKQLLASWPEVDADGEPTEVWIAISPGLSSPCVRVCPLSGSRTPDGKPADLILHPAETE